MSNYKFLGIIIFCNKCDIFVWIKKKISGVGVGGFEGY